MEYFKHLLIRTPFEKPAKKIQSLLGFTRSIKHPELYEIDMEPLRIEQLLKRVIKKSSNCIDIGCHLGSMLSEIIELSPHGSHIGFEAIPYKVSWLKQKFPEVEIKEIALSDINSEATFYINTNLSGFSGLRLRNPKQKDVMKKITVQCDTLDNLINPDYQVDFIKIDVEGGELAVMRGSVNTLSNHHPIILFECAQAAISSFGFTAQQIFEFLTQHSYSIFLIKDFLEGKSPLNFEQFNTALDYPFQAFNFVALTD